MSLWVQDHSLPQTLGEVCVYIQTLEEEKQLIQSQVPMAPNAMVTCLSNIYMVQTRIQVSLTVQNIIYISTSSVLLIRKTHILFMILSPSPSPTLLFCSQWTTLVCVMPPPLQGHTKIDAYWILEYALAKRLCTCFTEDRIRFFPVFLAVFT
jgi:hypothetical protein